MDPILRHIAACNNAVLPGGRIPLHLRQGGENSSAVGWVPAALEAPLLAGGGVRTGDAIGIDAAGLESVARGLSASGLFRWRGEDFDVRGDPDGPVLARLDRGALPSFGIRAVGVHLNGLVERADGPWLWVGRRAADKLLDPGKLDHIVAGGVPAGLTPRETLLKEAAEEAGLAPEVVGRAQAVSVLDYAMDRPEGLRRDRLHCYDLVLDESVRPVPCDGEVSGFELWPLPAVLDRVRRTDDFKFNVNLVLIDLFRRRGLLPPA